MSFVLDTRVFSDSPLALEDLEDDIIIERDGDSSPALSSRQSILIHKEDSQSTQRARVVVEESDGSSFASSHRSSVSSHRSRRGSSTKARQSYNAINEAKVLVVEDGTHSENFRKSTMEGKDRAASTQSLSRAREGFSDADILVEDDDGDSGDKFSESSGSNRPSKKKRRKRRARTSLTEQGIAPAPFPLAPGVHRVSQLFKAGEGGLQSDVSLHESLSPNYTAERTYNISGAESHATYDFEAEVEVDVISVTSSHPHPTSKQKSQTNLERNHRHGDIQSSRTWPIPSAATHPYQLFEAPDIISQSDRSGYPMPSVALPPTGGNLKTSGGERSIGDIVDDNDTASSVSSHRRSLLVEETDSLLAPTQHQFSDAPSDGASFRSKSSTSVNHPANDVVFLGDSETDRSAYAGLPPAPSIHTRASLADSLSENARTKSDNAMHDAATGSNSETSRQSTSASAWSQVSRYLREYDEEKIKDCKEDIDTLLVFAGLFSAILTAFNVDLYKSLQRDPGDVTAQFLQQISLQLTSFTISSAFVNNTVPFQSLPAFHPPASIVRINAFWFSSLVCSLGTASLGILVKQWLREYMAGEHFSPKEHCRIRHVRYQGLEKWRVFEIAAFLPLMIQFALILFFAGLCDFLQFLHPVLGWVVTSLVVMWLVAFVTTTFAPIFSTTCPYQTPFLKSALTNLRGLWYKIHKSHTSSWSGEEKRVRRNPDLDIAALAAADATFMNGTFLKTIQQCLSDGYTGYDVVKCMREILTRRSGRPVSSMADKEAVDALRTLPSDEREIVVATLVGALPPSLDTGEPYSYEYTLWQDYMHDVFGCVMTLGEHDDLGEYTQTMARLAGTLLSTDTNVEHILRSFMETTRYSTFGYRTCLPSNISMIAMCNVVVSARHILDEGDPPRNKRYPQQRSMNAIRKKSGDPLTLYELVSYLAFGMRVDDLRHCADTFTPFSKYFGNAIRDLYYPESPGEISMRSFGIPKTANGIDNPDRAYTQRVRYCLEISEELNQRVPDVVHKNLLDALREKLKLETEEQFVPEGVFVEPIFTSGTISSVPETSC